MGLFSSAFVEITKYEELGRRSSMRGCIFPFELNINNATSKLVVYQKASHDKVVILTGGALHELDHAEHAMHAAHAHVLNRSPISLKSKN